MHRTADQKIVIVRRATRLEGLRSKFATVGQAKFLMRAAKQREVVRQTGDLELAGLTADLAFEEVQQEDATYRDAVDSIQRDLEDLLPIQLLDRELLPTYLFGPSDVVITVGQDGLVANTAKYAVGLPIIGINPDPARFDGVLLPFKVPAARSAVIRVLQNQAKKRAVTLAEVLLADGQRQLAFNDFYIGTRTHVSARYRIELADRSEPHSSSGVLVSTGAGSTGWLSSVFNMAAGLGGLMGGTNRPTVNPLRLPWEDRRLAFVVREPFISRTSAAELVSGVIEPGHELVLESNMPQGGVIFSDGIESDFLEFNSGTIARIRAAAQQATLVV